VSRLVYASTDKCKACEDKKPYALDLCHGCYDRLRKHGTTQRRYGGTAWEVAWRYVEIDDESECWIWRGSIAGSGYGTIMFKAKQTGAHRFVFEHIAGRKIPDGLVLDHLCRNIVCCNPDHLEAVTAGENIRRGLVPGLRCGHDESRISEAWRKRTDGKPQKVRTCLECEKIRGRRDRERRKAAALNGLR
jgi:hypothetical protein